MLVLSRKKGQQVVVGVGPDRVTVTVVEISGGKIRLGFDAPRDVKIDRAEVRRQEEDRLNGQGGL